MDAGGYAMQVETGSLSHEPIPRHAYIAVEGWPSWAFVLLGMKFLLVTVRVTH